MNFFTAYFWPIQQERKSFEIKITKIFYSVIFANQSTPEK